MTVEDVLIPCGLIGLLIGAMVLTYSTRNSDQTPDYEFSRERKKHKKPKHSATNRTEAS